MQHQVAVRVITCRNWLPFWAQTIIPNIFTCWWICTGQNQLQRHFCSIDIRTHCINGFVIIFPQKISKKFSNFQTMGISSVFSFLKKKSHYRFMYKLWKNAFPFRIFTGVSSPAPGGSRFTSLFGSFGITLSEGVGIRSPCRNTLFEIKKTHYL